MAADPPPTAFGAVVKPQGKQTYPNALAQSESRYGRLGVIRYFDANAPDAWSDYTARWGDRSAILSFRIPPSVVLSGSQDQALRRFFAEAPTGRPTYWSYMHEPEDDIARGEMSAPAFRAAFAHVAALAAEAENPQLHATLIMMCYTANPTSGRNWRNYYAEGAVQLIAWDCYNHAWRRGTYGTPENLLDRAVATSQEAGLPWGIAELGSLVGSRDPDGSGRRPGCGRADSTSPSAAPSSSATFDTNGKGTD
jgi:hypothetical protein